MSDNTSIPNVRKSHSGPVVKKLTIKPARHRSIRLSNLSVNIVSGACSSDGCGSLSGLAFSLNASPKSMTRMSSSSSSSRSIGQPTQSVDLTRYLGTPFSRDLPSNRTKSSESAGPSVSKNSASERCGNRPEVNARFLGLRSAYWVSCKKISAHWP